MRPVAVIVAVAGLAGLAFAIAQGGGGIAPKPLADTPTELEAPATETATRTPDPARPDPDLPQSPPSRDSDVQPEGTELQRVEPRAPLSDLALALPPKPAAPGDWKGTVLYQPVAPAAGIIEAMGYRIALSGIEGLEPRQTCSTGGRDWNCGMRARTAFRAFLRGRAVTCIVPPTPERGLIAASCTVGDQDVAAWLVESGWVRAASGGPYEQEGAVAERAGKGMFGTPERTAPPPEVALPTGTVTPDEP